MKKGIHPKSYEAIFKDMSSDFAFITTTTIKSDETMVWPADGKTYPVVKFEVTSASHPFYTGTHKIMDTEGRLEKFKNKYAKATAANKK
jgi:large subunit ribosomal protein L31